MSYVKVAKSGIEISFTMRTYSVLMSIPVLSSSKVYVSSIIVRVRSSYEETFGRVFQITKGISISQVSAVLSPITHKNNHEISRTLLAWIYIYEPVIMNSGGNGSVSFGSHSSKKTTIG